MADPEAPEVVEEAGRLADGKRSCATSFQVAQGAPEAAANSRFADFERPDALEKLSRLVEQRSCSGHLPSEQHGKGSDSAEDERGVGASKFNHTTRRSAELRWADQSALPRRSLYHASPVNHATLLDRWPAADETANTFLHVA